MNIVPDPTGVSRVRGWKESEHFTLASAPANETSGAVSQFSGLVVNDLTFSGHTAAVTVSKSDIQVIQALENPPPALVSLTPDACAVDQTGKVTVTGQAGALACEIEARGQAGSRKLSQIIGFSGAGTFYDAVTAIAPGSLRAYLKQQQIAALTGVAPGASTQRACANGNNYSTNTGANANTTSMGGGTYGGVNANNFLRSPTQAQLDAGFTPLPTTALDALLAGQQGSGIEWRAWLSPHHYLEWPGHAMFGKSGTNWKVVGSEIAVHYSPTAWVGALVKLLPSNWRTYLPAVPDRNNGVTAIGCWARMFNTYIGGYGAQPYGGADASTAERRWVMPVDYDAIKEYIVYAPDDPRRSFQKLSSFSPAIVTGGDSGSPVFCGINGNLVILSNMATAGQVGYEFYADYTAQIEEAMNALATAAGDPGAGTFAVSTVDLSGFTAYP